ncbi:MAG: glycosyltransferase family 2 protein [Ardenticatenaceae bacterium]|nr:glycosyltransferase family 2 protein [Ardenticatenaceae bacterium]
MGMGLSVVVVLPTYNRAGVLGRAVDSVLGQTWTDFELIVVDDGSTDETADLLQTYDDGRLRVIRHAYNRGVAAARNTGILASRSDWVAFIDSDDEWLPYKLERQMRVAEGMQEGETAVLYSALVRVQNGRKSRFPQQGARGYVHTELVGGNLMAASTALVRRDCLAREEQFDERLRCLVDWELWLRLSRFYHFGFMDEPLVTAHVLPDGVSGEDAAVLEALQYIVDKHEASFSQDRKQLAHYYFLIGNHLCMNGGMGNGRRYLERAIKADSYQPRYRLARVVSFLGRGVYGRVWG